MTLTDTKVKIVTQRCIRYACTAMIAYIIILVLLYASFEQNVATLGVKQWGDTGPHVQVFDEVIWKNKSSKKILMWTTFFRQLWFADEIRGRLKKCPFNCTVTMKKDEIYSSDLVLFHLMDLFFWVKKPAYRSHDQIWLLYGLEPPARTDIFSAYLRTWRYKFNWTMTYRSDSTIFAPYGSYRKASQFEKEKKKNKQSTNIAKTKSKLVMGLASNCVDDARRYKLIKELKKYISIDMFGDCGDFKCPKDDPKCGPVFQSYKFILAFENSYCRDYVSEKFWRAITGKSIPIVNWKDAQKPYRNNAPPNSYINVYDFVDLQAFGKYIELLDNNDTLYNSYFNWKTDYIVDGENIGISHKFCDLCKALHHPRKAQTIIDPAKWFDDDVCRRWSLPGVFSRHWDRLMFKLGIQT